MKSINQIYEVWANHDRTEITCSTLENINLLKKNNQFGANQILIHKFNASTFEEAMSIYYLRMGFETYKPVGKPELCPNNCGSYYYPKGSGQCPYCGDI